MAVENFNPFEMAQRQFDNVAKRFWQNEVACASLHVPYRKLRFNISIKIAKCLLLFCVVFTISISSSNKAIADTDRTEYVLLEIRNHFQPFGFMDYAGGLYFREFIYIKPNGEYYFLTWIFGNINGEDIFVVTESYPKINSGQNKPDYEVVLQGNDLTINTSDELSSASVYDTRNGTLVKGDIPIAPNSSNCITLQDVHTPCMLQIISAGQVTFQSQLIINYSNQLISGGK